MKFYTDAQASRVFVDILRQLGWDVRTVYDQGTAREKQDYLHVQQATSLGRIFISFDYLRGESGAKVARELASNGGRVIKIGGGPDQSPLRAVGKLLFHHPDWEPFFRENDGFVDISDIKRNPRCYLPAAYLQRTDPTGAQQFIEYLQRRQERREERQRQPRARRPQIRPRDQSEMDLGPIDAEGVSCL